MCSKSYKWGWWQHSLSQGFWVVLISDLLRWNPTGRVFRRRNGWRWTMKTKRHRPSRNIIIIIALGIIIITIFVITILATIITITRVVAGLLLSNLMSLLLGAGIGICIYRRFLSIFDFHHFLHLLVVVSLIWTWKDILKPRSWRLFFQGQDERFGPVTIVIVWYLAIYVVKCWPNLTL